MTWSLKRIPWGRGGTPSILTQTRIVGDRQIDLFEAMCVLNGRKPHELASDLVLDAIRSAATDPNVTRLVRDVKRHRRGLHVVRDLPDTGEAG